MTKRTPLRAPTDPNDGRSASSGYPSPGAAVTVDILVKLSERGHKPVHVRELAGMLGVPRSTVHRVLQTLDAKGMVEYVDGAGYSLADGTVELGARYRMKDLPRLADPILRELHEVTGETVNLAVPTDEGMLVVAAVQSAAPLRTVSWPGKVDAIHASALGKAYLAALPHDAAERLIAGLEFERATSHTLSHADALRRDVAATRERGYALDDAESLEGVCCIGAAVRGENRDVVAALSVSSPASRLPEARWPEVGALVGRSADLISNLLWTPGPR